MTAVARPFDPGGPLPERLTVLEASAGTGKTYTIEGLVTRFVADGTPLPRLLVVTFTRMATAELRGRVRARLVRSAEDLDRFLALGDTSDEDEVVADPALATLKAGTPAAVRTRQRRLQQALAEFDAATISTIHGFSRQVLRSLGLTGDADRTATLIEDEREIVDAAVADLYVRRFHDAGPHGPAVSYRDLSDIARKVIRNADARIVPEAPAGEGAALRTELAAELRRDVARRKRARGVLSFDDVLGRLADTLEDPEHGEAARSRLRQQYAAALIDEFQDTDPVQWRIVQQAFGGDRPLVLIGDPKQAIYAFRGADVYAYLLAARRARQVETLGVNWRSDGPLLEAYNALFAGAQLGHPEIPYRDVAAAAGHQQPRLSGAPVAEALRVRWLPRHEDLPKTKAGVLYTEHAREHVAKDLAAQVVELLAAGATIAGAGADGRSEPRPVRPPDIAVLVRRNVDAALVQRHLRAVGVPAVVGGAGSVFATEAAEQWQRLLEALERPSSPGRVRALALTCFVAWEAEEVAAASDEQWDELHRQVHRLAGLLRERSVAALVQALATQQRLSERLLGRRGGERLLTDVLHIGELLHAAGTAEALGPTALATWLRDQIADADDDTPPDERARRLESDAGAIQVMTVHRSKGLEFPVLFLPFAWARPGAANGAPVFHDAHSGQRLVDVGGGEEPDFADHRAAAQNEQDGEELRLLYVALTRAQHQAVVWWAPCGKYSALARVLFCRRSDGRVNTAGWPTSVYEDGPTRDHLQRLAERAPGMIAVEEVPAKPSTAAWAGEPPAAAALEAARLDRDIDRAWRRASYSSITREHHEVGGGETVDALKDDEEPMDDAGDEPPQPAAPAADGPALEARLRAVPSPMADLAGGVAFGTFVHGVLEEVDFAADDLDAAIRAEVARHLRRRPVEIGDTGALVSALRRVLETPLGPVAGEVALRGVPATDRLDELDFELPLAGGRDARGRVQVGAIAETLRAHVPRGDPLDGYAERLADPVLRRDLRGYLVGSIDLVVRVPGPSGPRFAVVDHKTNWLGAPGEQLTAWHYRPAALDRAMQAAHYPLQGLLYAVALHRYLRWRLSGYDPEQHLGGIVYLFLRGMTGTDVPRVDGQPCGVFAWRPPAALVTGLSDLFDRGGDVA